MKKRLRFLFLITLGLAACKDNCHETRVFRQLSRFTVPIKMLREQGVSVGTAQALANPGKIYAKGNYLFINEVKKGIHLINNADPSNPKNLAFIEILGNADMAVRGNYLYADSYTDFLVFDISDPATPKQVQRIENAFITGMIEGITWYANAWNNGSATEIIDFNSVLTTQVIETNCESGVNNNGAWFRADMMTLSSAAAPSTTSGTGGSMARFAIVNDYLYAVTNQNIQLFDISRPASPTKGNSLSLGWGIETIFPYRNRLYIGTTTGLQILDNSNPTNPVRMGTLTHARACDPVVVHDNYAYVTLRSDDAGWCGPAQNNQLDLVDISNGYSPKLVKTFAMQNPYGLGIDFPTLFVCEGNYGLKVFDASQPTALNLKKHFEGMNAFDVLMLNSKLLMLIGKDGLYQYDYSDRNSPKLLSKIPVVAN